MNVKVDVAPEWFESGNTICAATPFTSGLIKRVLSGHALFEEAWKNDTRLYEMSFWDYSLDWFDRPQSWAEDLGENPFPGEDEFAIVERDKLFSSDSLKRVTCEQMHVTKDEVRWASAPKHGSVYITTARVPIEVFKNAEGKKRQ